MDGIPGHHVFKIENPAFVKQFCVARVEVTLRPVFVDNREYGRLHVRPKCVNAQSEYSLVPEPFAGRNVQAWLIRTEIKIRV